jgi:hypothetical protein
MKYKKSQSVGNLVTAMLALVAMSMGQNAWAQGVTLGGSTPQYNFTPKGVSGTTQTPATPVTAVVPATPPADDVAVTDQNPVPKPVVANPVPQPAANPVPPVPIAPVQARPAFVVKGVTGGAQPTSNPSTHPSTDPSTNPGANPSTGPTTPVVTTPANPSTAVRFPPTDGLDPVNLPTIPGAVVPVISTRGPAVPTLPAPKLNVAITPGTPGPGPVPTIIAPTTTGTSGDQTGVLGVDVVKPVAGTLPSDHQPTVKQQKEAAVVKRKHGKKSPVAEVTVPAPASALPAPVAAGVQPVVAVTDVNLSDNTPAKDHNGIEKAGIPVISTPLACEDKAIQAIYAIVQKDNKNILGQMYELTSMRLAIQAIKNKSTTLEESMKKNLKNMQATVDAIPGSADFQKNLTDTYQYYGKKSDLDSIKSDMDTSLKAGKNACYWSRNQRLTNDHASAFVLAMSISDKKSGLSDVDAGTIWAIDSIQKAAKMGHATADEDKFTNLTNISVRVARYLGRIAEGEKATVPELTQKIADEEKSIADEMNSALAQGKDQLQKDLTACYASSDEFKDHPCADCVSKKVDSFLGMLNADSLQRGLLASVTHANEAKMEKQLSGQMGGVGFDLMKGIDKGNIARETNNGKYDACGQLNPNYKPGARGPAGTHRAAVRRSAVPPPPSDGGTPNLGDDDDANADPGAAGQQDKGGS